MAVIEVRELRKRYGDTLAPDGVRVVEALELYGGFYRDPARPLLHVYAKLGVKDRAAAVNEAFQRGLLTPDRR